MNNKKLAVFDWNGTLFDDMAATHIATNASLAFFGKDPITLEHEQEIFTFPLIHFYEKMGVSVDEYLKHAEEVGNLFHDTYNAHKSNCTLAKDTIKILQWLGNNNVTSMILSNHRQDTLEHDVEHFEITDYFETISGNEDTATIISGLNKKQRLIDYIKTHGYAHENVMIIGDSHEEPEIAHSLEIMGISISGGLLSPTRLQKYKKDYVIDCLSELPGILKAEWNLAPIS
jgi:phosphoglycolate phosphatase-like HAD superfamily hydrolase